MARQLERPVPALDWSRLAVVGRGANYGTAFEAALKISELTGVVAAPYSSADFLHGPIAVVEPGFPILAIAPSGPTLAGMRELLEAASERGHHRDHGRRSPVPHDRAGARPGVAQPAGRRDPGPAARDRRRASASAATSTAPTDCRR